MGSALPVNRESIPKAIIVPHAGYQYSGTIAASAYSLLRSGRTQINRIVLLGPAHRVAVRGLALPGVDSFATPLGRIAIDQRSVTILKKLPQVIESVDAHAGEHSLEVQLPFLQTVLDNFSLVPLAVGDATPDEVAQVLEAMWGGDETLIVVSSDLTHYLTYDQAQAIDRATANRILALQGPIGPYEACGCMPINGLLVAAKRRRLVPRLLDLRNSGDTSGTRDRVVGYAAFAFDENA
jgi:MEMO1 family protein